MICLGFRGRTAMLVLYEQTDRYGCKGRQRQPARSNATMPIFTAASFYRDAVDRVRRDGFAVIGASCFRSRHGKRNHHRASDLTMAGFASPIAQVKRRRRNGRRLFLNTNTSIPGATFDISSASSQLFHHRLIEGKLTASSGAGAALPYKNGTSILSTAVAFVAIPVTWSVYLAVCNTSHTVTTPC